MGSYTGIEEIDQVLTDLYDEQVNLESRLREKPDSGELQGAHRRITTLIDRLLHLGNVLLASDNKGLHVPQAA